MIGANLFCAGAVAVMLLGTSPGRYWVLYAALAAENSGTVLYAPALQARVPTVVGTGPLLEVEDRDVVVLSLFRHEVRALFGPTAVSWSQDEPTRQVKPAI